MLKLDLDQERCRMLATGFLARVASADFKSGRLSRSLAGAGVAALREAIYGIVLDIAESQTLVELARDDIRELISRPCPDTHNSNYRRAQELEGLETCGWLLSGSTDTSLLTAALSLREAEMSLHSAAHISTEQVDEFLPLAFLAGVEERGKEFYVRNEKLVKGTTTPRGVAVVLLESCTAALPLVDDLLKRKLPEWFARGWLASAVPWLRIRAQLQQSNDPPFRVIASAKQFVVGENAA